jgi:inosine-uridine nucleoside N-ribohydrolase
MPDRVLIDTDPGVDDALALLMALGSERLAVEGITVVAGNCSLETCAANAAAVVGLAGAEVPISLGADRPLVRPLVTALHVHGQDGLGGASLVRPGRPAARRRAVDALIEGLLDGPSATPSDPGGPPPPARGGDKTLIAIGPLTNLALALRVEPRIAQAVGRVVAMGGAVRVRGNQTPAAEFNAFVDPHAAAVVLGAGWPVTLVPLDVTHQVWLTADRVAALRRAASASHITSFVGEAVAAILDRDPRGFAMHDPLAVAVAIEPDVVSCEPADVTVELCDPERLGQTRAVFRDDGPVLVATSVDSERALALFEAGILWLAGR